MNNSNFVKLSIKRINIPVLYALCSYYCRMKMKELSAGERPREKMLERGAAALSDGELIAVLFRGGSRDGNALDLARKIMELGEGNLGAVSRLTCDRLTGVPGIGLCKAASLIAAFELGRRFMMDNSECGRKSITTASMVFELMKPHYKGLGHEECWVLFLNGHNKLISKMRMSVGGGDMTTIDVRQIVKTGIEKGAAGIILTHNHPGGNPRPSNADIEQTESLHLAASACSMSLVDHVIICDDRYFSFSEDDGDS